MKSVADPDLLDQLASVLIGPFGPWYGMRSALLARSARSGDSSRIWKFGAPPILKCTGDDMLEKIIVHLSMVVSFSVSSLGPMSSHSVSPLPSDLLDSALPKSQLCFP